MNVMFQETASEHTPILNQLFRFYNVNASSVRVIMVADCVVDDFSPDEAVKAKRFMPDTHTIRERSPGRLNTITYLLHSLPNSRHMFRVSC